MPSFDLARARFRLSDDHLIVLSELASGNERPMESAAARTDLVKCGLISETGLLAEPLLPLLTTVLDAAVVISLETGSRQGQMQHGMLIGQEHVVAHESWPGDTEAEYSLVDPRMLVWKLASMVNLQQSAPAQDTAATSLHTTVGTMEAGLAGLEGARTARSREEESEAVRRSILSHGALDSSTTSLLTELICELRASWRMTAAWKGRQEAQEGVEFRGFAVWDCGPLGYWLRELPEEPLPADQLTPASPFRLVRTDARSIWTLITDLLPDADEVRAARAAR
ncbi:histidine kinase [Streptomyces sp. NPDC030392]|uniref:histidine kinase n=1 Tax=Streptomyces sp. NPDC030392 TaxID=3155468 RepID=UPI0033E36C81